MESSPSSSSKQQGQESVFSTKDSLPKVELERELSSSHKDISASIVAAERAGNQGFVANPWDASSPLDLPDSSAYGPPLSMATPSLAVARMERLNQQMSSSTIGEFLSPETTRNTSNYPASFTTSTSSLLDPIPNTNEDAAINSSSKTASFTYDSNTSAFLNTRNSSSLEDIPQTDDPWQATESLPTFQKPSIQHSRMTTNDSSYKVQPDESENDVEPARKLSSIRDINFKNEKIIVTLAAEKSGLLFKHSNYILVTQSTQGKVIRRYSDFAWLQTILNKKYSYRILPPLPPKKMSPDNAFLEQRRRGLSRYINFIVNHPILSEERVVQDFLRIQDEISSYRKLQDISLEEEFYSSSPAHRNNLPQDFELIIFKFHEAVKANCISFQAIVDIFEQVGYQLEDRAKDFIQLSVLFKSVSEIQDCPYLNDNEGSVVDVLASFRKANCTFRQAGDAYYEQFQAQERTTFERLKSHKESLESIIDLFNRCDRTLSNFKIEQLIARIAQTRQKIDSSDGKPNADEKEVARLTKLMEQDQKELNFQQTKKNFIKNCLWQEIELYHHLRNNMKFCLNDYYVKEESSTEKLNGIWNSILSSS